MMTRALKAAPISDDAFRLLAFPFGGPIPKPGAPRGADLDGEWFSPRTDLKADWFRERLVDWHHGSDPVMGRTVLGKAVDLGRFDGPAAEPDDDGWWVTVWMKHGERRVDLVRRLAERGATIYGSSETVASLAQKADTGEILVWPYVRQTLSTSPQNTLSVMRPLKATLDDLESSGISPSAAFWSDLEGALRSLGGDLRASSLAGELGAKAGRVLSRLNETDLKEALAELDAAMKRLHAVAARQTQTQEG